MSPPDGAIPQSGRLTLHLGVLVQPYSGPTFVNERNKRGKKSKAWQKNTSKMAMTTGDVAEILEAKYGVMAAFWRTFEPKGAEAIEESLGGAMESLMMGGVVDPWGDATQKIQQGFRDFISSRQAEGVGIPGTPTKAALDGVNHRLAHPYRMSNPRRPSFRDTGLYMASQRTWVTES